MACVELPVAAYLVKPVIFSDLLPRMQTAVTRFRSYQAMQSAEQRLQQWRRELKTLSGPGRQLGVARRRASTCSSRSRCGTSWDRLPTWSSWAVPWQVSRSGQHPCQLLNCPRGAQLQEAVRETIRVLEETKNAFKSKALGELRQRLELILEHN